MSRLPFAATLRAQWLTTCICGALLAASPLLVTGCGSPGGSGPGGPQAQPIQSAVLGGTQTAFTAKFGTATSPLAQTDAYRAMIQGTPVQVIITIIDGSDGQQHVDMVGIAPPHGSNTVWDDATASMIYTTLLPLDTTHVNDAPSSLSGVIHVEHSAALAATFKPALFANTSNQLVTPGTFSIQCLPPLVGQSGSIQCQISLGELFT